MSSLECVHTNVFTSPNRDGMNSQKTLMQQVIRKQGVWTSTMDKLAKHLKSSRNQVMNATRTNVQTLQSYEQRKE